MNRLSLFVSLFCDFVAQQVMIVYTPTSYRTEKAVSLITELNINQNIRLGYSYDMWLNELKTYNKGSHEFRVSFDLNVQKRILTPRYF